MRLLQFSAWSERRARADSKPIAKNAEQGNLLWPKDTIGDGNMRRGHSRDDGAMVTCKRGEMLEGSIPLTIGMPVGNRFIVGREQRLFAV